MSERRDNLQIQKAILESLKDGESLVTRIAYKVAINGIKAKNELDILLEQGCVTCSKDRGRVRYSITEEGLEKLGALDGLSELLDIK